MQENNFEKQVQQKTDELKLQPSDEVWQKVVVAITKRKNDRRILAIVILLLLFISSVIFIMLNSGPGRKTETAISEKGNPEKTNGIDESIKHNNTLQKVAVKNAPQTGSKKVVPDKVSVIKNIPVAQKTGYQQKNRAIHIPLKPTVSIAMEEPRNNKKNIIDSNDVADNALNIDNSNHKNGQQPGKPVNNNPVALVDETTGSNDSNKTKVAEPVPVINDIANRQQVTDSAEKDRINSKNKVSDTMAVILKTGDKKNALLKGSIQSKQKSKWKLGFNFSLGMAATRNGYLGIIGSGSSDESKAFADIGQSNGNPGQGSYTSHNPSKIKSGLGLVLGLVVQKNISPKTTFLFGLNYKTYNSSMMIGNKIDSLLNPNPNNSSYYYSSGNTYRYKNHFHFLELPVALSFKLGRQNKVPVYINTGISIAQLINSRALQFDTSFSGSYYIDNSLFNKTQLSVSVGMMFSLSGLAKNAFLIGPDINFNLNKMANSGLYKDRHYSYFGIRLQKSIGKK